MQAMYLQTLSWLPYSLALQRFTIFCFTSTIIADVAQKKLAINVIFGFVNFANDIIIITSRRRDATFLHIITHNLSFTVFKCFFIDSSAIAFVFYLIVIMMMILEFAMFLSFYLDVFLKKVEMVLQAAQSFLAHLIAFFLCSSSRE